MSTIERFHCRVERQLSALTCIDSTRDPTSVSRGPTRSLTGMDERTHPIAATNRTESRDSRLDRLAWVQQFGDCRKHKCTKICHIHEQYLKDGWPMVFHKITSIRPIRFLLNSTPLSLLPPVLAIPLIQSLKL